MRAQNLGFGLVVFASFAFGAGCGGGDDEAPPSIGASGSGGSSGASAGSGGSTSNGGTGQGHGGAGAAGASGHAGAKGGNGGASGQGGAGGTGGAAGHGGAGTAGMGVGGGPGGAGGKAGNGGGAGQAGKGGAGAGGSTGGCQQSSDCALPSTTPPGCAVATCDPTSHECKFAAKDADGDGHATSLCKANDGTPVVVGDDCDDNAKNTYTGAWDGPAGDGHPNECDGIDEDCDGLPDDGKTSSGASCTCAPNDVQTCSTDSGGKPITWPTGKPVGACKYGSQSCLANGTWGPCTGAVVPSEESCNHLDDDCNGMVDDGPAPDFVPLDAQYYVYDGDDDDHAGLKGLGYPKLHVCSFDIPTTAPDACTKLPLPCALGSTEDACCPGNGWKLAAGIPQDDCNDQNSSAFPGAPEVCGNKVDDNCNGDVDEGCTCNPGDSLPCSKTATGEPITWPAGTPKGTCAFGSALCGTNGQLGQCNGAIAPAANDRCDVAGNDDDCNGVPNDTCTCIDAPADPTYTTPCAALPNGTPITFPGGVAQGSCKTGTETCQSNGTYGQCLGANPPLPADSCTVVGDDSDCDGVANDPASCDCIDVVGNPTYKAPCDEYPDGTPINFPGGTPIGTCASGVKQCTSTGKYGSCVGAVAPETQDDCSVAGGRDTNCDGVIECPCAPVGSTSTTACPNQKGACAGSYATCGTNGYGACSILPKAQDDCSVPGGIDANCDGIISCPCTPIGGTSTTPCTNQKGVCAGAYATCGPNGYGACSVVPQTGDDCSVPGGKDTNCNGVNDCPCSPIGGTSTTPCPNQKGVCSGAYATCGPNGYGACSVVPQMSDDCSVPGGHDSNCDGTISCSCSPVGGSSTTPCNQKGSCAGASAVCGPTGYGSCTVNPAAYDTCDSGVVNGADANCDGIANEGCLHINGTPCGSAATCNVDGVWQSCKGDGTGCVCSIAPAPVAAGTYCNYLNNTKGACNQGGQEVCTGPNSAAVSCTAQRDGDTRVGMAKAETSAAPWNGSWDWDCSGTITISGTGACTPPPGVSTCTFSPARTDWYEPTGTVMQCLIVGGNAAPAINGTPPTNFASFCAGFTDPTSCNTSFDYLSGCGSAGWRCSGNSPACTVCGAVVTQYDCEWNATTNTCGQAADKFEGRTWIPSCY